jgi:hypothetical protein
MRCMIGSNPLGVAHTFLSCVGAPGKQQTQGNKPLEN